MIKEGKERGPPGYFVQGPSSSYSYATHGDLQILQHQEYNIVLAAYAAGPTLRNTLQVDVRDHSLTP